MKKRLIFIGMLIICLLCFTAQAEETSPPDAYTIPEWTIVESGDGLGIPPTYLDSTIPVMSFSTNVDEYGDGDFTVTVGSHSFTQEGCCALSGKIYVMKAGRGTLIMVPEYGPSDDPYTYCLLYTTDSLLSIGAIPALPEDMTVSPDGLITTTIRAKALCTWFRPADYMLSAGYKWDDTGSGESEQFFSLCEIPRAVYPMGMIVSLQTDLPVYASQFDTAPCATLAADSQVILTATDDRVWLYVTSVDGLTGGWVRMDCSDYPTYITVNDEQIESEKVFKYMLFAD